MSDLLERALADVRAHPDSTAGEIAGRLGVGSREVFRVLDMAAWQDKCERWMRGGESAWRWQAYDGTT